MATETERVEAQRAAIQEHVFKWLYYRIDHEKAFAIKTIVNCQDRIKVLKHQAGRRIPVSWEDDWVENGSYELDPRNWPKKLGPLPTYIPLKKL